MAPVLLSLSGYALTLAPVPVSVPNAFSAASYRTGYGTNKGGPIVSLLFFFFYASACIGRQPPNADFVRLTPLLLDLLLRRRPSFALSGHTS